MFICRAQEQGRILPPVSEERNCVRCRDPDKSRYIKDHIHLMERLLNSKLSIYYKFTTVTVLKK